jgi:UDP-glucose 4-epimerase
MKVLITGGAGFIGSNLAELLTVRFGVEVRILDDLSTGLVSNLDGLEVELVEGSLEDESLVRSAADGCTSIVHLAALGSVPRSIAEPLATHRANVNGTLNVLETARVTGAKVVFSSSSSVYGSNPTLPKVETMSTLPMSPYAVSKLAGEQYVRVYGLTYGIPVLPFRFFNVFGPKQRADHQYAAVIPRFVDAVLNGRPPIVHGDGTQSRDFTFVGDVASILAQAATTEIFSNEPVNLAFGGRHTLLAVLDQICKISGKQARPIFEPTRVGDVPHSQADGSSLARLFPDLVPTPTSKGLTRTIEWFTSL